MKSKRKNFFASWSIFLTIALCLFSFSAFAADESEEKVDEKAVAKVEKRVVGMNGTLKDLLKRVANAREANDVRRLNCLLTKVNLVKGLIRASERAKGILMESFFAGDLQTASNYRGKVFAYSDSVEEIRKTAEECGGVQVTRDGTTLVYIRPDTEELESVESSPWDWDEEVGADGYPVIPPASPFR